MTIRSTANTPGFCALDRDGAPTPGDEPVPRGQAGRDVIVVLAVTDGFEHEIARLDGRYISTEVVAGFTGCMLGWALRAARARSPLPPTPSWKADLR